MPGTEALSVHETRATTEEARRLAVEPGHPLLVLERVRTANGRPIVYTRDIVPRSVIGGRRPLFDRLDDGSIYDLLDREFGVVVQHGVASFQPLKADRQVAAKLKVIRGALSSCTCARSTTTRRVGRCCTRTSTILPARSTSRWSEGARRAGRMNGGRRQRALRMKRPGAWTEPCDSAGYFRGRRHQQVEETADLLLRATARGGAAVLSAL